MHERCVGGTRERERGTMIAEEVTITDRGIQQTRVRCEDVRVQDEERTSNSYTDGVSFRVRLSGDAARRFLMKKPDFVTLEW